MGVGQSQTRFLRLTVSIFLILLEKINIKYFFLFASHGKEKEEEDACG